MAQGLHQGVLEQESDKDQTLPVCRLQLASRPPAIWSAVCWDYPAGSGHGNSAQLTVSCVALSWWSVLKDDWHESLANDALPSLGHLAPDAAVGRYLARGGRVWREGLGVARGQNGEGVGVFPYKVAHGASDELKAVRICSRGHESEVASGTHLQDLGERDLLQEDGAVRLHTWNE